jgi:hypothetical protein
MFIQNVLMAGTERTALQNVIPTVSTDPVIIFLVNAPTDVNLVGKDRIVSKVYQVNFSK